MNGGLKNAIPNSRNVAVRKFRTLYLKTQDINLTFIYVLHNLFNRYLSILILENSIFQIQWILKIMMKSSFKIPTYIIYDNAPPLSQNETYKSLQLCLYILVALKPKVKFLSTVFLSSAFSVYILYVQYTQFLSPSYFFFPGRLRVLICLGTFEIAYDDQCANIMTLISHR